MDTVCSHAIGLVEAAPDASSWKKPASPPIA